MKLSKKSTFALYFFINKSKTRANGQCPIYLRITIDGEQVALSIKRTVDPKVWDKKSGLALGRNAETRELNRYIDAVRAKAYETHTQLMTLQDVVTAQILRDAILGINTHRANTLFAVWEEHNQKLYKLIGIDNSYTTYQKYCTCKKYMEGYLLTAYKLQDVSFKAFNSSMLEDFEDYLRIDKGCSYNTTIKYLQNVKRIFTIAKKNGWLGKDPFEGKKLTLKETDRPFLDEDELSRIIKKEFGHNRLEQVRDMFLLSCFTGLAYIDLKNLKRSQLQKDSNSSWWIRTRRQKTKTGSTIPVLPQAWEIIKKHCNLDNLSSEDRLLNVISNQKMNAYLHEIEALCGIEKNLTFHVARHTFATTVTLMNGVSMESVSKMLGHKNLTTTQHYARIVDKKIEEDMSNLSEKLATKKGLQVA